MPSCAEHVCTLAASVFDTDIVVWLADGDRTFVHGGKDRFPPGLRALVRQLLEPEDQDKVVVQDTELDARSAPLQPSQLGLAMPGQEGLTAL